MKVYVGTVGLKLVFEGSTQIEGSSVLRIYYRKPSGVEGYWNAEVEGGTNVAYVLREGDLDEVGVWVLQPYVEVGAWRGRCQAWPLTVYDEFDY